VTSGRTLPKIAPHWRDDQLTDAIKKVCADAQEGGEVEKYEAVHAIPEPVSTVSPGAEYSTSTAYLDPVDKRNIEHARVANAMLLTMREHGREFFRPEDMSDLYSLLAISDRTAGHQPSPLHPVFSVRTPTSQRSKDGERSAHDAGEASEGTE
jgi:hypothetical protein